MKDELGALITTLFWFIAEAVIQVFLKEKGQKKVVTVIITVFFLLILLWILIPDSSSNDSVVEVSPTLTLTPASTPLPIPTPVAGVGSTYVPKMPTPSDALLELNDIDIYCLPETHFLTVPSPDKEDEEYRLLLKRFPQSVTTAIEMTGVSEERLELYYTKLLAGNSMVRGIRVCSFDPNDPMENITLSVPEQGCIDFWQNQGTATGDTVQYTEGISRAHSGIVVASILNYWYWCDKSQP